MSKLSGVKAGRAQVEIFGDNSRLIRSLGDARRRLDSFAARTSRIGATLFGAGLAAAVPFGATLRAASDVEETMNKFNVVFGTRADAVKAWGDTFAGQVGRAENQIADFLAGTQDLFVPLGFEPGAAEAMSKQVTQLAVDLASFNNKADADVLRDLHAALTGSGEVMKKYGVIVQDAEVKQELFNQGLDPNKVTNQQKVMARLAIIMRGTTAAHGDAIRSADSYANMQKAAAGATEDLAAEVGKGLLPTFAGLFEQYRQLAKAGQQYIKENTAVVTGAALVTAGLLGTGAALLGIAGVAKVAAIGLGLVSGALGLVGSTIGFLISPIGLATAAVVGLGYAALRGSGLWDSGLKAMGKAAATLKADAVTAWGGIASALESGDLGTAAQIGWSLVELEWIRGTSALDIVFADWSRSFLRAWTETWTGAELIAGSAWRRLWDGFRELAGLALDLIDLGLVEIRDTNADGTGAGDRAAARLRERSRRDVDAREKSAAEARQAEQRAGKAMADLTKQQAEARAKQERAAQERIDAARKKMTERSAAARATAEAAADAAADKAAADAAADKAAADAANGNAGRAGTSQSGVASQLAYSLVIGKSAGGRSAAQKQTDAETEAIDKQTAALKTNAETWRERRQKLAAQYLDRRHQHEKNKLTNLLGGIANAGLPAFGGEALAADQPSPEKPATGGVTGGAYRRAIAAQMRADAPTTRIDVDSGGVASEMKQQIADFRTQRRQQSEQAAGFDSRNPNVDDHIGRAEALLQKLEASRNSGSSDALLTNQGDLGAIVAFANANRRFSGQTPSTTVTASNANDGTTRLIGKLDELKQAIMDSAARYD